MKKSLSIILPSYNEEQNIPLVLERIADVLKGSSTDYEVIIVNDGSTDKTGKISERLSTINNKIRVIHNSKNRGMGYAILRGIGAAQKEFVTILPSDNEIDATLITSMIQYMGKVDLMVAYMRKSSNRTTIRRILSKFFVIGTNLLFGLHLRYFTGPFLCKRSLVNNLSLRSEGHTLIPELLIRLVKSGASYEEIPFDYRKRMYGKSKSMSLKSFYISFKTMVFIFGDIYE